MTPTELLDRLTARGITLRAVDDRIQAKPMSALLPDDREQLQRLKAELLGLFRGDESTDEILAPDERQRLMTETVERLSRQYTGWPINWPEVDANNRQLGETFSQHELKTLLAQYESAVWKGQESSLRTTKLAK